MELGSDFAISEISFHGGKQPFVSAVVSFRFRETFADQSEVAQVVRVTVRTQQPTSVSVADLHEVLLAKAREALSLALRRANSGTAAELSRDSDVKREEALSGLS